MATIVLQAAGAFLGGLLGSTGGVIGGAVGAVAGYWLDQTLIRGTQTIEGQRLSGQRPFVAEEGASLPRVYGAARIGGTLIWATRFEEEQQTRREGSKAGGAKVTEYSYYANVAFALCEGPIAGVRRIWADGRELDQTEVELRVHRGDEAQLPDPLIEAKQGTDNAPAYRGTAYVVFERLPLTSYGNRIPQFQFEVLRPVNAIAKDIRAVALIPGSSEYGLSSQLVTRTLREGETVPVNRHLATAPTDLDASLDELQALCPNLEHVALVATWFGDDLRCGHCTIRPKVTDSAAGGFSAAWKASGVLRADAAEVSTVDGRAAFGGSPGDLSVMQAIAAIKARGLKVTLYPFVMMDVPADNALPDPYGGAEQAKYPWRGRITGYPGPDEAGSADGAAAARTQVAAFVGAAEAADFTAAADTVLFAGGASDWGYRRFVLHFAKLAQAAGGVDAFLIGSEMRGLTTLRDDDADFPFVEALCDLAGDVRAILGPATKLTYAADWSEYFGHQPAGGDVFYHLDPLWAHEAIDAVGIDNYMPLSDWRDADYRGGNPDGFESAYDPEGLRAAIDGGEGFDWHYASEANRAARVRSPITDGAYGKPWVYRYKDLVNWWSNQHHDRTAGVEHATPTAWIPRSKPIWFTELGCPAIDKGPNQPNVFSDPKSSEDAFPHFSNSGRSDLAQARFLEAHFGHWNPAADDFVAAKNPASTLYDGRMVDHRRTFVWAWDARPFPAWPLRTDEWSDGYNWHLGHWLNGRLSGGGVGDVINAVLADHGLRPADTRHVDGSISGYVVDDPTTARAALEPIVDLFGLAASEGADGLVFAASGARNAEPAEIGELVWDGKTAALEIARPPQDELPAEALLGFRDPMRDYQAASVDSRHAEALDRRKSSTGFPGVLETGQAQALLDDWLRRLWSERETLRFSVPVATPETEPGALIRIAGQDGEFVVTEAEDGIARRIAAKRIVRAAPTPWRPYLPRVAEKKPLFAGRPLAVLLDLPMLHGAASVQDRFRLAVWQKPWRPQAAFASPDTSGYAPRATAGRMASIGRLLTALSQGIEGRVDLGNAIEVELFAGELASVTRSRLLNGANAAAIQAGDGWEIVQFEDAEEFEPDRWRLRGLLRAQLGTDDAMRAGHPAGSLFVLLDSAVIAAGLTAGEIGLTLNWRIGPAGAAFTDAHFVTLAQAGGLRAKLPLSPVHLRTVSDGAGGLDVSWVRRGRIDADDWDADDIPLGEDAERYRLDILTTGGALMRSVTVTAPGWTYPAGDIAADFGAGPASFDIRVRQVGTGGRLGVPATLRCSV